MLKVTLILAASVIPAPIASAQWSTDPSTNVAVATKPGAQVQTKIVAIPGGGTYVSWFDNSGSGYDVYLQRLDADGNKAWADEGLLVADRSFSSTQDYGLAVNGSSALMVFRDDRFGGTRITFTRISSNGTPTAGADGIQIENGTDFVAAPKVSTTMIAWTRNNEVVARPLVYIASSVSVGDEIVMADANASFLLADLRGVDGGDVVSLVRQTSFNAPKHLYAQKFLFDLTTPWGMTPMAVFDSGSLQFGNFPSFVPDGSGGAVFSWYDVGGGSLQTYVQRIRASGELAFAPNGVATSTNARARVAPTAVFNEATQEALVVWREQQPGPTPQDGIYAQKLSADGDRLWTDNGIAIAPLATVELTNVNAVFTGDTLQAFWTRNLSFGDQRVTGAAVAADGSLAWQPTTVGLGTSVSAKSRLVAARNNRGFTLLAWSDERTDGGDIFAQHVNDNGSTTLPDTDSDGITNDQDNCILKANPNQVDVDGDGFGNVCDGDFNNDCIVSTADLGLLRVNFFQTGANVSDLNADGQVNVADLGIFRTLFFQLPGPAATPNGCSSE